MFHKRFTRLKAHQRPVSIFQCFDVAVLQWPNALKPLNGHLSPSLRELCWSCNKYTTDNFFSHCLPLNKLCNLNEVFISPCRHVACVFFFLPRSSTAHFSLDDSIYAAYWFILFFCFSSRWEFVVQIDNNNECKFNSIMNRKPGEKGWTPNSAAHNQPLRVQAIAHRYSVIFPS